MKKPVWDRYGTFAVSYSHPETTFRMTNQETGHSRLKAEPGYKFLEVLGYHARKNPDGSYQYEPDPMDPGRSATLMFTKTDERPITMTLTDRTHREYQVRVEGDQYVSYVVLIGMDQEDAAAHIAMTYTRMGLRLISIKNQARRRNIMKILLEDPKKVEAKEAHALTLISVEEMPASKTIWRY